MAVTAGAITDFVMDAAAGAISALTIAPTGEIADATAAADAAAAGTADVEIIAVINGMERTFLYTL